MIKKFILSMGLMLTSNSLFFTQIIASAEDSSAHSPSIAIGFEGAAVGGIITAVVLISKSRTKHKATKADQYKTENLELSGKEDVYIRTETTSVRINKDND